MATIFGTENDESLNGTMGDDVIFARGGADTINGGGGDDVIVVERLVLGSDVIDGGSGADIVVLEIDYADVTVSYDAMDNEVVFTSADGTESVTNVERVEFADQAVLIVGAGGYTTIQDAVDAAPDGALILVNTGNYAEQVVIDGKNGLTIEAVPGAMVTIQSPLDLVQTATDSFSFDINALVTVTDSANVVLRGITIDGLGNGDTIDSNGGIADFVGVFYRNASGGLEDVDVTGIRDPYEPGMTTGGNSIVSGLQRGFGVIADNDALTSFFMDGGSITDFQKSAAFFSFADLSISGVTVTGGGAQPIQGQNGIQVQDSTGSISNSSFTGIGYAGPQDVYSGAIIGFANTDLDMIGNTIVGANMEDVLAKIVGIYLFDGSGGEISGNQISFVDEGIDYTGVIGPVSPVIGENSVTNVDTNDSFSGGVIFGPDDTLTNAFDVDGSQADDVLSGALGADTLAGLDGGDLLVGNGGADMVDGGAGDDTIAGGAGGDTLDGGADTDTVSYLDATGEIVVVLQLNKARGDGFDTLINIENAIGSNQNDRLTGSNGNNRLSGRDGDDVISGLGGNDLLFGGNGFDTFVFKNNWGLDRVFGFDADDAEKIDLSTVTNITDFEDLITNHLRTNANNGNAEIFDGTSVIQLVGITTAQIGNGLAYDNADFIF